MHRTASCTSSPGARPRLILDQPAGLLVQARRLPEGYWIEHFDIRRSPTALRHAAHCRRISPRAAYIGDAFPELAVWGVGAVNPRTLMRQLDYGRAVKTPYELACLREASRLGALGHRAAAARLRAGASEFEIELAFLEACGLREQELPYNPIIALNAGGAVLHYQVLEKQPPARAAIRC